MPSPTWRSSPFRCSATGVLRAALPAWLKIAAAAGMGASAISLFIAVYPVVDVVSRMAYAAKISSVVLVTNIAGVALYRAGRAQR